MEVTSSRVHIRAVVDKPLTSIDPGTRLLEDVPFSQIVESAIDMVNPIKLLSLPILAM